MARPGIILGTMEFGRGPCVEDVPQQLMEACLNFGDRFKGTDTAHMYSGGKSETILGNMEIWKGRVPLATKINPWDFDGKSLNAEGVKTQVATCLSRLRVSQVEILYLHAPDHGTPLTETLAAVDQLHREGKFKQLGLSNYSSWLVTECVNLCKANGWVTPTVYQGMYSAITRQVESELIPCLRYHGIAFYAYSPLGGGILSGKYKFQQKDDMSMPVGRFKGLFRDNIYRSRFWKEEHFNNIETLRSLLSIHHPGVEIPVAAAAFRWIFNHSMLDGDKGDCVILGASRVDQIQMNLGLSTEGPLEEPVVKFLEDWWNTTRHICPNYFR